MRFAFYTLGCKTNQYETQAMEQLLMQSGHTLGSFDEICDGYIINTCTVTAVSDKKSRNAIRRVRKLNPVEALAQLKAEGYTHVIIQSTNIIDGIEMELLRKDIDQMRPLFKEIRLGMPLLYTPEDYKQVIDCLAEKSREKTFTILVGHGTYTPATAQYAMLDYMLQAEGHSDFAVGTVEGYPTFDNAVDRLQAQKKIKQVQLVPFMFVAGDHAKNDIAVDMKEALEEKGYKVTPLMEGLGEQPAIQQIYIDHIRFILKHKQIDIVKKKKDLENKD